MRSVRGGRRTQNRLVVILGVVGLVLGVPAFVGPWFVVTPGVTHSMFPPFLPIPVSGYGLLQGTSIDPSGGIAMASWNYAPIPGLASVFLVAAVLTGLGLASGAAMVFVALGSRASQWPRWRRALFGFAAFGLMLTAALYVVVALPAIQGIPSPGWAIQGFWGSTYCQSYGSCHSGSSHGAGWAWYTDLVVAVLFLVTGILMFSAQAASTSQATAPTPSPPD
jgi:hypothetical protein